MQVQNRGPELRGAFTQHPSKAPLQMMLKLTVCFLAGKAQARFWKEPHVHSRLVWSLRISFAFPAILRKGLL